MRFETGKNMDRHKIGVWKAVAFNDLIFHNCFFLSFCVVCKTFLLHHVQPPKESIDNKDNINNISRWGQHADVV